MTRACILGAQEAFLSARHRRLLCPVCGLSRRAACSNFFFATLTRPLNNASVATSDLPTPKRTIGVREPSSLQSAEPSPAVRVSTPPPSVIASLGTEGVSEALARLGVAARGGSASEAYEAYLIAASCITGEGFDPAVRQTIGNADSSERAGPLRAIDACMNVAPSVLEERYSNIRIAAVAGVKGASAHFLNAGPPTRVVGAAWADDPNVIEWTRTALILLQRDANGGDANGGDINALALLARVHSDGSLGKKDFLRAFAYQIAFDELLNAQNPRENGRSVTTNTAWLEGQLLEPERQLARELSADILKRCCSGRWQSHIKGVR